MVAMVVSMTAAMTAAIAVAWRWRYGEGGGAARRQQWWRGDGDGDGGGKGGSGEEEKTVALCGAGNLASTRCGEEGSGLYVKHPFLFQVTPLDWVFRDWSPRNHISPQRLSDQVCGR